ncbi:MAG TPA: hypothetical protein VE291_00580 [Terracidiphilus sp.]|jgi:hypothetical protein|nr:hypothetical protein [Terracidiphilus sp.]
MAPATLVSFDIENGDQVIKALEAAGKSPKVALWAKLPDYENWRLVLAADELDRASQFTSYSAINRAMKDAAIPIHRQPAILLRPMNNPMIAALRQTFSKASDVYGMRLGGQRFGDKYLEDAFVYRIR